MKFFNALEVFLRGTQEFKMPLHNMNYGLMQAKQGHLFDLTFQKDLTALKMMDIIEEAIPGLAVMPQKNVLCD